MIAVHELRMEFVPLSDAIGRMRGVPLDCDTMIAARDVGISFGD